MVDGPRLAFGMVATSADKSSRLFSDVGPWLIVLVALVLVGGVVIYLVRKSLRSSNHPSPAGFTLHDLRTLHANGDLSDEEFERARSQMIGRLKSESPPSGPGRAGNSQP